MIRGRRELGAWCERTRLTRKQTATRLGISQPYLCQLLLGERTPSAALMGRIEHETGIPMRAWLETITREAA